MIKSLILIVSLWLVPSTSLKLVKTKVSNGITVSLPAAMFPMTPDDMAQRYPSVRAPLGAFTDQDRAVDFSVNISATNWPDANVELAQKFFRAGLYNLYDRIDLIAEGTQILHKRKFIFFEFDSRINGDKRKQSNQEPILKYTYIQYLVESDRTLVFTFSCPREQKEDWRNTAREIMKSVRVK